MPLAALHGCGLPQAWAAQRQWRILDTGFGLGLNFLATWRAWKDDPQRPRLLHFVAIEARPATVTHLLRAAEGDSGLAPLAHELADQWFGLLPGAHRLVFEQGRVMLTLHVNDVREVLRREPFVVDAVFLRDPALDLTTLKGVARHCRRGTRLVTGAVDTSVRHDLEQCGFAIQESGKLMVGEFAPAWEPKKALPATGVDPSRCVVVGAGLAGAAVASSLALRGWQVTVLDASDAPASGASGVPVGLLTPHFSTDDSLLSRLSRSGVRTTMAQARALLEEGVDWRASGVLERREDAVSDDAFPKEGLAWNCAAQPGHLGAAGLAGGHAVWHAHAGWIKPGALVRAWLSRPGILWRGRTRVERIVREGDAWALLDNEDCEIERASLVVVAAALASNAIAGTDLPLQAVRGQVSWAQVSPSSTMPPFPLNGNGHFIPDVPVDDNVAWFCGSTFGRDDARLDVRPADHAANFARLQSLVPAVAAQVQSEFAGETVQAWTGIRCASSNRRPIVIELQPGLWMSTAMGSRGLTFSKVCAELLAARLHAEPLPLQARLADTLTPPSPHGGGAKR